MRLDPRAFLEVVKSTPLVAIDLVVRDPQGRILLGLRRNAPAQGVWFVPGGRVFKDETLADAFRRIGRDELGVELSMERSAFLGVYEHLYPDNFAGFEGVGTHYVVLAHEVRVSAETAGMPTTQHREFRWIHPAELAEAGDVHPYTRAYSRVAT